MRLLQLQGEDEFSLVEYHKNIPPYAILSHTWGADDDEINFKDLTEDIGRSKDKTGYRKLTFCGKQAARDGLNYFWIDTCCINKSSSQELTEAINSMFQWYQKAERCYVYLSDISYSGSDNTQRWKPAFKKSRWFTRGWTLQELIAPTSVDFFSKEGSYLGNKQSLEKTVSEVTGITVNALRGGSLSDFTIEERFSWAEKRTTTRGEDSAYCLLGIFDLQIPLLYAEGREKALKRLKKEIREHARNEVPSLNEAQKQNLLDSLRFDQMETQRMSIKQAHIKTCKWLSETPEYLDWLDDNNRNEHHGVLWVKGKPGTGKSTLMKFALDEAQDTTTTNWFAISFFFNARGENIEKSTIGLYQSLLLQILERFPTLQHVFSFLGVSATNISANHQWTDEALKTMLRQAIMELGESSVVCFIDALDECEEYQVRDMVSFFEDIGKLTTSSNVRFRVCFSSRHYPHITIQKGLHLTLEGQQGHNDDITSYLESELRIGQSLVAQQIRLELQHKAAGIFMWVVLVVGMLNKDYDNGRLFALRRRLQDIPNSLHELFRNILTRDSDNKDEVILCIQWVLFARRPLSPEELYFAVLSGVDPEMQSEWNPADSPMDAIERFILSSSKGLAEITKSTVPRVQFIHESVKNFLLKENSLQSIWPDLSCNFPGQGHEQLTHCCLRYLQFNILNRVGLDKTPLATLEKQAVTFREMILDSYPLSLYVVRNVFYHANLAEGSGLTQAKFLHDFPLPSWSRLSNLLERYDVRTFTQDVSLLYVLAYHNASHLIKIRPSNLSYLDVEAERHGTPLFAALSTGSEEAVNMFVEIHIMSYPPESGLHGLSAQFRYNSHASSIFNYSFIFKSRRTVLSYLAELGDTAIFALALQRTDILADAKDRDGRTPLTYAAKNGFDAIIKLLLETGKVDVDSRDNHDHTPLSYAIRGRHAATIELLLESGKANASLQDEYGRTYLYYPSYRGNESIVMILLRTGRIEVNLKDRFGRTPLMYAAEGKWDGTEAVVRTLLQVDGIDIDAIDRDGRTPLSFAAGGNPDQTVVQLLLDTKMVFINRKDNFGRTALWYAAVRSNVTIVNLLLQQDGIDIDCEDVLDLKPLDWAEEYGHRAVAMLLRSRLST